MITKIHTSRNIAATVSYVLNPEKRAEILLSKGIFPLAGAENITCEFEMQSALRPEAKTKLLHIPMSFHVRDRDLMERDGQAIVREWLHRMETCGFHFDQYIVVRHHDQDHKNPHFHLVINLTLADGRAVKTSYIGKYSKLVSMEVRNWAMEATDSRAQRTEPSIAQPKTTQSATSEPARPAATYTMNDTSSADAPTDSSRTEIETSSGIAAAMMELLVQPTVVHTAGGGGGSKEADDEKKNKPRKRFLKR